ncbi:tetratricopeptide repeat protein [Elizabethkingia anophelis]|nr:tetratricopeptide repeat protein [Elizabethkingia anophelis]
MTYFLIITNKYVYILFVAFVSYTGRLTAKIKKNEEQNKLYFTSKQSFKTLPDNITAVDSLLRIADNFFYKDFHKSLYYSQKALKITKKQNNSNLKAEAYYYVAKNFLSLGKYNESFNYIGKGMEEPALKENNYLTALFRYLKICCYAYTNLSYVQIKECQTVLDLIATYNDIKSKLLTADIYMLLVDYYIKKHDYTLAHMYADKSIKIIEGISNKEYLSVRQIYRDGPYVYYFKSLIYINQNNNHKLAYYFLTKAYNQALLEKQKCIYPFMEAFGDYYYQIKDYQKSIDFYLKAIENEKEQRTSIESEINLKISRSYNLLSKYSDKEKYENIFMKLRLYEKNKDDTLIPTIMEDTVNSLEKREQTITHENRKTLVYTIIFFIMLCAIIIYINYRLKNKKKKIIKEKEGLLLKNEIELKKDKQQITTLQKMVNKSFEEVIHLAKTNSPQFWARFREVYPDFYIMMLEINPKIKTSELTFCAYLYLEFTTKEIAEYTFVTIRGVETRRNRLRKKYNIPSDIDFSIWLNTYKK